MENASRTYGNEERREEEHKFIVFFLNEDEEQSVHVEEVEEIDFLKIVHHVNLGGSVFITHRKGLNPPLMV